MQTDGCSSLPKAMCLCSASVDCLLGVQEEPWWTHYGFISSP